MNRISKLASIFGMLAAFAMTTGCAGDNLRADYDPAADFSRYNTYNFYSDAGPESTNYQSFFSTYMVAAISREMEARGYTKSNDPDLLVNFNAVLTDKTKVTTSPGPSMGMGMGGYYGYRGGYYDPWMGYGYSQQTHVSQYTEGTFNIDLVDAREKKLIWEAVGVGRVNDELLENLEEKVNEGVPKFFALYPFVAGDGVPQVPEK